MKKYYNILILFSLMAISCTEIDFVEPIVPSEQKIKDNKIIDDYISSKGYTNVDTTSSGVRFVILDEGLGDTIQKDDIFTVNYFGKSLDGVVVSTNIQEVVDTAVSVSLVTDTTPIAMTHSESGWTFSNVPFVRELIGDDLEQGMAAGFSKVRTGGHFQVYISSIEAFGGTDNIWVKPYTVFVFEFFPVEVK